MQDIFIATLGPASAKPAVLQKWVTFVDMARFNASHARGDKKQREEVLTHYAWLVEDSLPGIPMAYDTRGRERRIGELPYAFRIENGQSIELGHSPFSFNGILHLPFDDDRVYDELNNEHEFVLCDGQIRLRVENKTAKGFVCRAIEGGGEVSSGKSIMFPKIGIDGPVLTVKDQEDIEFIQRYLPVFVWFMFSFIQTGADMDEANSFLASGKKAVCKPENALAMDHIRAMAKRSNMLMVPRGDGRQAFGKRLPLMTRFMIKESIATGTPAFVGTGVTTSMVKTLRTLSQGDELAIWTSLADGACGFMESDATAVGECPDLVPAAVKNAMRTFRENEFDYQQLALN